MSVWWPLQKGEVYLEAGKPAEHWVLQLTSGFASVQMGIETMVGLYLARASPALADKITKKHLRRLSDEDRWDYLKALASDAGYKGDQLNGASDAFWRCKRVRDLVGHLPNGLDLSRKNDEADYRYHYPIYDDISYKGIPDPLTPKTFRQLGAECRWLDAFINHIGFLAGQQFISARGVVNDKGEVGSELLEMLEPQPLPVPPEWEPSPGELSRPLKESPPGHIGA